MNNINSYIIINKQNGFIIKLFIFISIVLFISLLFVLNLKYTKYYQTKAYVINKNNEYKLIIYLSPNKLNLIKDNDNIVIENIKYKYKINSISKDYILINNLDNYKEVILNIELKEKDKINNNILEVKFLESKKKIIYYLKEYIKEGVKKWN